MSKDAYSIYQVLEGEAYHGLRSERLNHLRDTGPGVVRANYELVYHEMRDMGSHLSPEEILEGIYTRFTTDCPLDFAGSRPVGMGDVVMLHRGGEAKAYYCDYVGFVEVPEFIPGPFRYYSTQRPIDIGTIPKEPAPEAIVNYDYRMPIDEGGGFEAWGVVQYATPLNDKAIDDFELRPSDYNLDRGYYPKAQLDARVQVVGRWELENNVPEARRCTHILPVSGRFCIKDGVHRIGLTAQFNSISRRYWHGIDAQLAKGAAQAEKDNAARPTQPPKNKDKDR